MQKVDMINLLMTEKDYKYQLTTKIFLFGFTP